MRLTLKQRKAQVATSKLCHQGHLFLVNSKNKLVYHIKSSQLGGMHKLIKFQDTCELQLLDKLGCLTSTAWIGRLTSPVSLISV